MHFPRPPDVEPVTQSVTIMIAESDRIAFQKEAERCGLSLAEWILSRLREAARREAKDA